MKIAEVFPENEIARLLGTGEIREHMHPDGGTHMWSLESVTPSSEMAAKLNGVVFRDGEILARPIRKFWPVESEGFPETRIKNFSQLDLKKAAITEWIDGHAGLLYYNRHGIPMIGGCKRLTNQPWIWASAEYRRKHASASWPAEYTPNFVVTHPNAVRVIEPEEPRLVLVGLVHLKTGEEIGWQDLKDWAEYNQIPVPDTIKASFWDFPQLKLKQRGAVMRWDFADQTFRVGWITDEWEKKAAVADFTPLDIAEMLEQEVDLEPLKKQGSAEFGRWVENWRMRLYNEHFRLESKVVEIGNLADNVTPPVGQQEFDELMELYGKACGADTWALPILARWLLDKDYQDILWEMVKNLTKDEGRFQK